jgi:hypothetical protein
LKISAFRLRIFLVALCAVCQGQDIRRHSVRLSTLRAPEQSAINSAILHWNRQFEWKAQDNSANMAGDTSVATSPLGPPEEEDLIVTDQSGCSPTGNCSILVLRPIKKQYRVVLEAIGQTFTATSARANGFHDIQVRMHGSATMSTVKIYKFNGTRYVRTGCYDEISGELDKEGNLQELDKPRRTPCQ